MKLKEDMSPLLLQVFRSVVWVYSVITFLPWYLLSGASGSSKRVKARSVSTTVDSFNRFIQKLGMTFLKYVSYPLQDCIYWIKNKEILNIITI